MDPGLNLDAPDEQGPAAPRKRDRHALTPSLAGVGSRRILGMRVDGLRTSLAANGILELAEAGAGGMVCVATVHMVMEAFDAPDFQRSVNAADLVTPDGVPLVWSLRKLGLRETRRVYGPTLMRLVCRRAEECGLPVGLYGGSPEVLERLQGRLIERYPLLRVAFSASPPFRPQTELEDASTVQAIEASGVRILFVGLGCPKQERWMAAHREALPCVMLGVGAAFDFLAGSKRQAPGWLQRAGLEWLFRLASEPRRLWRRYLIQNPRFMLHFARQLARGVAA
jgi:N-acetylglucosaminyldiphosphoundecaprenol N-acetyl-beta-D-mannosaminyltransferase